jgi:beta propeller repeat protein
VRGPDFPVTQAQAYQSYPVVFGDVIAWEDWRDQTSTGADIWMKDLATGVEAPVTQASGNQELPAVFGGIVVWEDFRDQATTGADIWMKDLATGVEAPVTQAANDQLRAAIFGDIVVWEDYRDQTTTGADIWMMDLATGVEEPVTQAADGQTAPAVYGDIVVWVSQTPAGPDIWMMDLATGVEEPVTQAANGQYSPAVYGDIVAWDDYRDSGSTSQDVWMRNLVTGVEAPVTQAGLAQSDPAVFGDLILWQDDRDISTTGIDIWMRDLATGMETPLTQAAFAQSRVAVYGHLAAWQDDRSTTSADIYAARIDGPPTEYIALEGPTRYETAAAASQHAYRSKVPEDREGFRTVVVATGRNWPDALGASALAGVLDAPVLITQPDFVPAAVKDEIARLDADRVIFAGGEDVVMPAVEAELRAAGITTIERLAGPTRYETAEEVARRTAALRGARYDGVCFVATGLDFPDALAAAPVAAAKGWPIFLAGTQGLSAGTLDAMDDIGVTTAHILGGPGAVSGEVEQVLRSRLGSANVTRQMGPTRYETAVSVARFGVDKAGLQWDTVAIATGEDFPDALTGGALQARTYSVLLLTRRDALPPDVSARLTAQRDHIARVRYLGGADVVTPGVRNAVAGALH